MFCLVCWDPTFHHHPPGENLNQHMNNENCTSQNWNLRSDDFVEFFIHLKSFGMSIIRKLVVSTTLKNISQNGSLAQVGMNINNIWNHHQDLKSFDMSKMSNGKHLKHPATRWPDPDPPDPAWHLGKDSLARSGKLLLKMTQPNTLQRSQPWTLLWLYVRI